MTTPRDWLDHGVPHSERRERFCGEFVQSGGDGARAFRMAFVCDSTANMIAIRREVEKLLKDPAIKQRIVEMRDAAYLASQIDARQLLQDMVDMLRADPNEIVSVRRTCCRHCWGIGYKYQFATIAEWQKTPSADCTGGFGYDAKREPNATCPNCYGEGHAAVHITDSRQLSPGARKLFKSAKQDRYGAITVEMHDQQEVRRDLMKVMGLMGKDGQSVLPAVGDTSEAPPQAATSEAARDAYFRMLKRSG